jgi:outer membrane receptor for ferrienterochelin and colicin
MWRFFSLALAAAFGAGAAGGATFGALRGIVHDPDHRPVPGAFVRVKSASSEFSVNGATNGEGAFEMTAIPAGEYEITVFKTGFTAAKQRAVVTSGNAPVLHFQLAIGSQTEEVTVSGAAPPVNSEQITPTTILSRDQIQATPGADLSNSLNAITDHVPGAWIVHDQLHIRGGHQVSWAIDGVPIPNTNIASNVGPQIDPKDVDYLEAQRGGYSAAYGDRTYAVFNVVPRTGFERNREGEFYATYGSFHQTNDQLNFGDHTGKFAYFGSISGNRSNYGLETPGPDVLHDRVWGLGGLGTFIYNRDPNNQFRLTTALRSDDYQIPVDPAGLDAGIRDVERERDALVSFSWAHTFRPGVLLTTSPFYHYNRANYDGDPNDTPLSTTQQRGSQYAGAQLALSAVTQKHNASAGVYGFAQHDDEFVSLGAPGTAPLAHRALNTGHLEALFLEDQFKPLSWLTLTAGARITHFSGAVSENAATPRTGAAVRIPRINWILHAFWGEYYQPPPLSTVTGPLLEVAAEQGFGFIPLYGERDQEHQFGVTVPFRGWTIDVNNYHQRARNYFDHNAIGNSNVFFPLTIDGARLYGWEVSLTSPRIAGRVSAYINYARTRAEGMGGITGGLTDFSPPESGYFLLDHDQQHSVHAGFQARLPWRLNASGDLYYGSGFTDGTSEIPGAHLPGHTTFDFALSKAVSDNVTLSVTALNLMNRRFLLDNSPTFGGTHYADPRQIYMQVRYRFHL